MYYTRTYFLFIYYIMKKIIYNCVKLYKTPAFMGKSTYNYIFVDMRRHVYIHTCIRDFILRNITHTY